MNASAQPRREQRPCYGMLSLEDYVFLADNEDKRKVLRDQWSEATERGSVHCTCGLQRALPLAFRCLYCGQWFCGRCAEQHFGQTIHEWIEARRNSQNAEVCRGEQ